MKMTYDAAEWMLQHLLKNEKLTNGKLKLSRL